MSLRLKKYLENKSLISIKRNKKIDINILSGFLLGYSKELILIMKEYDFYLDGFKIIRVKDTEEIKTSDTLKFQGKMLKIDGDIEKVKLPFDVKVKDMFSALSSLKNNCDIFIVEIEGPKVEQFLIGKIVEIKNDKIKFEHFDGTGKWVKKDFEIKINDITTVEFCTNYINRYGKHIDLKNTELKKEKIKSKKRISAKKTAANSSTMPASKQASIG